MKYGINAPPEERNGVFTGMLWPTDPDRFTKREIPRRKHLLKKCDFVRHEVEKEKARTEITLCKLGLHLTKLRRKAKLLADLQSGGIAAEIRKEFQEGEAVAAILTKALRPVRLDDTQTALHDIEQVLELGVNPEVVSVKPSSKRMQTNLDKKSRWTRPQMDLPCDNGSRRARNPLALKTGFKINDQGEYKSNQTSSKIRRKIVPQLAVPENDAKNRRCCRKICGGNDSTSMSTLLAASNSQPLLSQSFGKGMAGVTRGGDPQYQTVPLHKEAANMRSIFDASPKGYIIRNGLGCVDCRAGAKKYASTPPLLLHQREEQSRIAKLQMPEIPIDRKTYPAIIKPTPPPPRRERSCSFAARCRSLELSGSHNVIPLRVQ